MNRNILLVAISIVAVIAVGVWVSKDNPGQGNTPSPTPLVSPSGSGSPVASTSRTPSANKTVNPAFPTPHPQNYIVQTPVPRNLITGPATCQLEGRIVYQDKNTYITEGAKMKFQNVDDSARLIYWTYSPNDGTFTSGPNIFANIRNLPNGELTVGSTWQPNKTPTAKSYQLTAKITYGVYNNEGIETGTAEANCTGSITVTTP
jgi:hypothetical protein